MNDVRYILADPIELEGIGTLYPSSIREYSRYMNYFNVLNVTINLLLQQLSMKDKKKRKYIEDNVKNFDIVCENETVRGSLINLLEICFKKKDNEIIFSKKNYLIYILNNNENKLDEDSLDKNYLQLINLVNTYKKDNTNKQIEKEIISLQDKFKGVNIINRDNYDYIRNQILKINNIRLPKQSKNAELQKWFDKAKNFKNKGNDKINLEDIIVAIVSCLGILYKDIGDMTVYQINKLVQGINNNKQFDMNVDFICAGATDIKLDSFIKHLDDEEEKITSDFNSTKKYMEKFLH